MVKAIKKAKLSKRTNRKQSFKKFIESGYTDIQAFNNACKNDENLLIYTCLEPEELQVYIDKMKEIENPEEQVKYLVNNQPIANSTVERYDRVTKCLAKYLKGYIDYSAYRLSNSSGDNQDWSSEFWAKYCKICNFYRTRWFFPETLKKQSTVTYNPILLKELVYILRCSLSSERKHLAFLATQSIDDSLFKVSLDTKLEVGSNEKTLAEVIPDEENGVDYLNDTTSLNIILDRALKTCKQYPDAVKYYNEIKDFYYTQDTAGLDKKAVILGKIFLYKAGLVSPKILAFIKSLSSMYKAKYNISTARLNTQAEELKDFKVVKYKKQKTDDLTWRDLIFMKRGEI